VVLNLVWVLGFLITISRKQDGGDDGLGPEPIPFNSKLWCFFLLPLIILCVDGVMINDCHHLRGEGGGYSSKSSTIVTLAMTAMVPKFALS